MNKNVNKVVPKLKNPSANWTHLPRNVRRLIVDKMDPVTRGKFSICSKICEREAKESEEYVYGIKMLRNPYDGWLQMGICHREYQFWDYWQKFIQQEDSVKVEYRCHEYLDGNGLENGVLKWSKIEKGRAEDVRLLYFNNCLNKYEHSIKSIFCDNDDVLFSDFSLRRLCMLKELYVNSISMTDMKSIIRCGLVSLSQIYNLKFVIFENIVLEFKHILLLNASIAEMAVSDFDEEKLRRYLERLKMGEVHSNLLKLDIRLRPPYSEIDVKNAIRSMEVFDFYRYTKKETWYKFSFRSEKRKMGKYQVVFEPRKSVTVEWQKSTSRAGK